MTQSAQPSAKAPRLRSPAYPGINLETAIVRAKEFYAKERRNAANVTVAVQHWGFNPSSGGAYIIVAALKSFGLLDEEGSGKERKVKLSSRGLRIVLDDRPESQERMAAIKEAATSPRIHGQLWKKYRAHLPSDANLRHELIFDWKFNENTVDWFIKEYRDTIRFAQLTDSDTISSEEQDSSEVEEGDERHAIKIGDYVQWESQGVLQFTAPKRVTAVSDDGEYAFVEGNNTGMPTKELSSVEPPAPQVVPGLKGTVRSAPPAPFPPDNLRSKTTSRQDVFSLEEGTVTIQWPVALSPESFEDLSAWLDILKRKIGRSVSKPENPEGTDS
jgi:hypothetical protein